MLTKWLDQLPPWAVFLVTVVLVLAAIEGGYRFAARRRHAGEGLDAPVGSVVSGMLGLLAFLLAFTFAMTAARFDTRKELLLEEVNAIDTCYLRAGLAQEAQRVEVRRLLREYVHLRAELPKHPERMAAAIARSATLQDELWSQALVVAQEPNDVHALFVESVDEVIALHRKRLVVSEYRIPGAIWLALYVISTLAMVGVGFQFGLTGGRETAIGLALAVTFAIVVWLIASLERTSEGALQVSQQPMVELDAKLSAAEP